MGPVSGFGVVINVVFPPQACPAHWPAWWQRSLATCLTCLLRSLLNCFRSEHVFPRHQWCWQVVVIIVSSWQCLSSDLRWTSLGDRHLLENLHLVLVVVIFWSVSSQDKRLLCKFYKIIWSLPPLIVSSWRWWSCHQWLLRGRHWSWWGEKVSWHV